MREIETKAPKDTEAKVTEVMLEREYVEIDN